MSVYVIWVDREHAKLFQFSKEKMERKSFRAHRRDHHTHRMESWDTMREEVSLFSEITTQLTDASKVLILGPGVAKHHFQTFLMEQHPALARKIIACVTVDHPSDAQIAAMARDYLRLAIS